MKWNVKWAMTPWKPLPSRVYHEVIPVSNDQALQWAQRRVNQIASKTGLAPHDFEFVAEFRNERGRVLYKPLGRNGFSSIG